MFGVDDFVTLPGVLLSREIFGEYNLKLNLFLKDSGIVNVSARKSSGNSEPFIWGNFNLRKKIKSKGYFVDDVEIFDDMMNLRTGKEKILTALKWSKTLTKYLMFEQPDNDLLTNLYWSMKLLTEPKVPCDAVDWRFIWRWLELWGLAPDLVKFHISKNFNDDEIYLLAHVSILDTKGVKNLFSQPFKGNIRENVFKVASKLAVGFLNQK